MEPSIKAVIDSGRTITGLLHVGSNDGEEVPHYQSIGIHNIALFEPLRRPHEVAFAAYESDTVHCFNVGLYDQNVQLRMNVTENDKASSVLDVIDVEDWTTHEVFKDWNMGQWPVVDHQTGHFIRYDKFAAKHKDFDPAIYNAMCMDVQGVEEQALKGFGDLLEHVDYILIELSEKPVYKGQMSGPELSTWLGLQGFRQVTPMTLHDNVLFIREGK